MTVHKRRWVKHQGLRRVLVEELSVIEVLAKNPELFKDVEIVDAYIPFSFDLMWVQQLCLEMGDND